MSEERERWSGGKRCDGLAVVEGIDGFVIMPSDEGLPISRCPCCDEPFPRNDMGLRGAKLVADMLYPMTEEARSDAD
jgi:hypothetical protein